jgi:putative Mg2+ transporter-C (MgtC) family protein
MPLETSQIVIRILLSVVFGGIIGLERQYHYKPAGFATNTLICVGSALFTLMSLYSASLFGGDPARIAAQIVAGVGFLGAGSILREGNKISGLTTAASIWLSAAIGMAIGYGSFVIAGVGACAVLVLQIFVRKLTNKFGHVKLYDTITIKCKPALRIFNKIKKIVKRRGSEILKEDLYKEDGNLVIKFALNMSDEDFKSAFKELVALKEIISISK